MLDAKLLKENPSKIDNMLKMRGVNFPLSDLVNLDKRRRELIIQLQELKHEKNILANSIARKKKETDTTTSANDEISKMKDISNRITQLELEQDQVLKKYRYLMMSIPNLLHESVPVGSTEKENVVIKERGNKRAKLTIAPKDHIDIATSFDLIDLERAAKISGARFYFLKNDLVKMNLALIQFGLDYLSNSGYALVQPPYMIRKDAMEGAVILGDFEQVIYKVEGEDLYMIGTSEHAMVSMHMDEILDSPRLPLRYACVSPCFRKEAGAHGRDMKGIFRVHQFEKVEQVVFSRPEDSWKEHERMLELTERIYENLGLPFRTVLLCSGDLGKISAKTYDIEAWFPGQSNYREIVSCSNCIDYQARRLRIRYRDNVNDETKLVHTLNSTLIATERTMVSIIENYQTDNGTVQVPDVLQKYMGDTKAIKVYSN
ncbi:MAG TPA: serine--tRNA ligase [Nitrososphaeraceae archaeon]|nr:serine--tRNA ligase [Nitrososphaeraceae archaeon]